jgi:hypothetical protein
LRWVGLVWFGDGPWHRILCVDFSTWD